MGAFKGDSRGLLNLSSRIRDLAGVPSQAAKQASEGIYDLIDQEFNQGTDPYGKKWAKLRPATLAKGRHPPPLTDTGDMRDSVEVKPMKGSGVSITIDQLPAWFHQWGTEKMAARPILPSGSRMPGTWDREVADAIDDAVKRRMGR